MKASVATILLASTALGQMASPAFAQAAPAAASDSASDIVVTARRTEERLQDVPISITVFSQAQITNRNITTAGDLATYTPSLSTNDRFGPESTSFAIRGFVQEGPTSPSVGVYFADVVAPRANGGTTNGNGAGVGSLFDLQNVQVLKGPQGTLFGRNTTGGAVLLVPQKPTSRFEGYVEGSLGNYNMHRVQAVLNTPLGNTIRFRVGLDHQDRDGWLHNVSGVGPKDFNDVNYTAVRASLVIDVTPDLENYTIGTWSDSDTNGYSGKVYSNVGGFPSVAAQLAATSGNYYDIENGQPNAHQHIRQWGLINTTTWHASDTITIKNIVSYTQFRQAQASNIFGDYQFQRSAVGYPRPAGSFDYAVGLVPFPGKDNTAQATFTEELQVQGRTADDKLSFQAGAYFERATPLDGFQTTLSPLFLNCTNIGALQCSDLAGRATVLAPGVTLEGRFGSISQSGTEYRFRNIGIYTQSTYKFTDWLSLTGGIRYTMDKSAGLGESLKINFPSPNVPLYSCSNPSPLTVGGTSAAIAANNALCNFARTVTSKKPTWLIDLDLKPTENVLVYGKYARGYRQGSINVSSYGLESWGPEKVDTYEIGAKTSWRGAVSGTFNIAAFYNDFSNQQLQVNTTACGAADLIARPAQCPFAASPAAGIANAGKSTIKGIEIDASISPARGLRFDGSYAYLDSKLKSITLPAVPVGLIALSSTAIVGGPLTLTPKNKFSLTGTYTLPLDAKIGRVSLSATYTHQDKMLGTATAPVGFQYLPPQKNLNLNLAWNDVAQMPLDLSLFVTNLTKEKFFTYVYGASFGFDAANLNQPRMFGARLRYRFGR